MDKIDHPQRNLVTEFRSSDLLSSGLSFTGMTTGMPVEDLAPSPPPPPRARDAVTRQAVGVTPAGGPVGGLTGGLLRGRADKPERELIRINAGIPGSIETPSLSDRAYVEARLQRLVPPAPSRCKPKIRRTDSSARRPTKDPAVAITEADFPRNADVHARLLSPRIATSKNRGKAVRAALPLSRDEFQPRHDISPRRNRPPRQAALIEPRG